jgi:tetratricopeptide (TPR) repeat protein
MARTSDLTGQDVRQISCAVAGPRPGTGVVVSREGLVVTAAHVMQRARRAEVRLSPMPDPVEMVVVKTNTDYDVALLRPVAPPALGARDVAVMGSASGTLPGARFTSFGYRAPREYDGLFASGTIANEVAKVGAGAFWWQLTSGQIGKGMSGAPVLDVDRNLVVGIVVESFIPLRGDTTDANLDFAVQADVLSDVFGLPILTGVHPLGGAGTPGLAVAGSTQSLHGAPPAVAAAGSRVLESLVNARRDHERGDCLVVDVWGSAASGASGAVRQWVDEAHPGWYDSVFWWTFSPVAPADHFVYALRAHLGLPDTAGAPRTRVSILAALMRIGRHLLVLDGPDGPDGSMDLRVAELLDQLAVRGGRSLVVVVSRTPLQLQATGTFRQISVRPDDVATAPIKDLAELMADPELDDGDRMTLLVAGVRAQPLDAGDAQWIRDLAAREPPCGKLLPGPQVPAKVGRQPEEVGRERGLAGLESLAAVGLLLEVSDQPVPASWRLGPRRFATTAQLRWLINQELAADPELARTVHRFTALGMWALPDIDKWDDVVIYLGKLAHLIGAGMYRDAVWQLFGFQSRPGSDDDSRLIAVLLWRFDAWGTALETLSRFFVDGDPMKGCHSRPDALRLRYHAALCLVNLGRPDQALDLLTLAVEADPPRGAERVTVRLLQAELWAQRGDLPRARRLVEEAGAAARLVPHLDQLTLGVVPSGDVFLMEEVQRRDGWLRLLQGDPPAALDLLRDAGGGADPRTAPSLDAVVWYAEALVAAQRWSEADDVLARLEELDSNRLDLLAAVIVTRWQLDRREGRATSRRQLRDLDRAVVLARSSERPVAVASTLTVRGLAQRAADPVSGRRDAEEALSIAQRHGLLLAAIDARLAVAQLVADGDPARSAWEHNLAIAQSRACGYGRTDMHADMGADDGTRSKTRHWGTAETEGGYQLEGAAGDEDSRI